VFATAGPHQDILASESGGTHGHALLSQIPDSPNLEILVGQGL
jgi:hypothetical protein